MASFVLLSIVQWRDLGNEVFGLSRLAVIVCPTVHGRKRSWPVSVDVLHRCGPLQRVTSPWVLRGLLPFVDAVEVVPYFNSKTYEVNYCFDPLSTCGLLKTTGVHYPEQTAALTSGTYNCLATVNSGGLESSFCSKTS